MQVLTNKTIPRPEGGLPTLAEFNTRDCYFDIIKVYVSVGRSALN